MSDNTAAAVDPVHAQDDYAELARGCRALARRAGAAIMRVYAGEFEVERKDDNSPLTAADLAAHRAIVDGLHVLTPRVPVLSEESAIQAAWDVRRDWVRYWLVDPLDGTREFVKRNGEFTVNIALVEDHDPTLGIVFAPALDEMYWAWRGGHAFFRAGEAGAEMPIRTRRRGEPLVVAGSRSHPDPRLGRVLASIGSYELKPLGSSLKFCRTARGVADIYVRYGLTSEWDTAAGQCVLEQAGGAVTDMSGAPLRYNEKESLLNPDFLAVGDPSENWAAMFD